MPPGSLVPQEKSFFSIQSVNTLKIDFPALSSQECVDTRISVANSRCGNVLNPQPQLILVVFDALVSV